MKTCALLTASGRSGALLAGSPSQPRDVDFGRVDRSIGLRDYPQVGEVDFRCLFDWLQSRSGWGRLPLLVRLATVPDK
jgi:hypothetical protein